MSTSFARDCYLDRGIICFTERQRRARVSANKHGPATPDHDAVGVALDRDRDGPGPGTLIGRAVVENVGRSMMSTSWRLEVLGEGDSGPRRLCL